MCGLLHGVTLLVNEPPPPSARVGLFVPKTSHEDAPTDPRFGLRVNPLSSFCFVLHHLF